MTNAKGVEKDEVGQMSFGSVVNQIPPGVFLAIHVVLFLVSAPRPVRLRGRSVLSPWLSPWPEGGYGS